MTKETAKNQAESEKNAIEANSNLEAPTAAEKAEALKEGALEAVKQSGHDAYLAMTDGVQLSDAPPQNRWLGSDEIQMWAHVIDYGVEQFEDAVSEKPKDGDPIPDTKVAGLLKLERAGKNRTPYVAALKKRLKIDSVYEVTDAGPDYTNDITPTSKL